MALTPQPLFRAQDIGTSTVLGPVVPKNWKVHLNKQVAIVDANPNEAKPRYNSADYTGNAYGDDVAQAKANIAVARSDGGASETLPPTPRTQQDKATALGTVLVQDVGRRRGWIAPSQPYTAPPVAGENPTIASLAPNTAVAGAATPQFAMKIIGTKFTPYSTVLLGGVPAPSSIYTYISATEMRCQMSPASSVAGTTTVTVVDHGVASTPSATFTWT
jgi:IPT/TIG domain